MRRFIVTALFLVVFFFDTASVSRAQAASERAELRHAPLQTKQENVTRPDEAHGQSVRDQPERSSLRAVSRALLWVPRGLFMLINYPVQGAVYLVDRFELPRLVEDVFFDDTRTIGLYPTAFVETGFGLNVGLHFVHRNLLGRHETLHLDTGYGGRFSQNHRIRFDTGQRLGPRWQMSLEGGFEAIPNYYFFGLGSETEEINPADVPISINPYESSTAIQTASVRDQARVRLRVTHHFNRTLSLGLSGSWRYQNYSDRGSDRSFPGLFDVYDPRALRRISDELHMVYNELDVTYDSRRGDGFAWPSTPSSGWRGTLFGGYNRVVNQDGSGFIRGGLDLVRNWNLFQGTRVFVTRFYAEGVSGPLEDVPLFELPAIGGPALLRGYFRDRFRDRASAVVSGQYNYVVSNAIMTYAFVDAGRVFRSLDRFFDDDSIRVGFGGGLQFQGVDSVVGRVQFAASKEGGLFLELRFDRGDELRPETER